MGNRLNLGLPVPQVDIFRGIPIVILDIQRLDFGIRHQAEAVGRRKPMKKKLTDRGFIKVGIKAGREQVAGEVIRG